MVKADCRDTNEPLVDDDDEDEEGQHVRVRKQLCNNQHLFHVKQRLAAPPTVDKASLHLSTIRFKLAGNHSALVLAG